VKAHCKRLKLSYYSIGEYKNFTEDSTIENLAIDILRFSGMKEEHVQAAMYGVSTILCDNEMGVKHNWSVMYDLAMLAHAIKFADKFMCGNRFCEVGMKYPQFDAKALIKKYKLTLTTVYEPMFSRGYTESERKTYYEIYQNETKTISFSFEKDRMGKGGYAGATFQTLESAVAFTKWFFNHKSWYVKDWDLFTNGLGGIGHKELIEINSEHIHYNENVELFIK